MKYSTKSLARSPSIVTSQRLWNASGSPASRVPPGYVVTARRTKRSPSCASTWYSNDHGISDSRSPSQYSATASMPTRGGWYGAV